MDRKDRGTVAALRSAATARGWLKRRALSFGDIMKKTFGYLFALGIVSACATRPPVPEHTLFAAEVVAMAVSDSSAGGIDYQGEFLRFPDDLFKACAVARTADGRTSLALLRFSYYWHNGGARVRENIRWYPVPGGVDVSVGNLVVVDLMVGAQGPDSRCPWISHILADDLASGGCSYLSTGQGSVRHTLSLISPIGGPGSASLDCPELLSTGWQAQAFGLYGARALVRNPTDCTDPAGDPRLRSCSADR